MLIFSQLSRIWDGGMYMLEIIADLGFCIIVFCFPSLLSLEAIIVLAIIATAIHSIKSENGILNSKFQDKRGLGALLFCALLLVYAVTLLIAVNSKFYGLKYLAPIGTFMNFVVMMVNGFQMPVCQRATRSGMSIKIRPWNFLHTPCNAGTKLKFLVDRIDHPIFASEGIQSIGDIVWDLGLAITGIQLIMSKWF